LVLRHLRYFLAVAEEGTIAGAAARLRIAQPALSRQIHDMETTLQAPLFDRGHHGVTLTAAGEFALRHVVLILRALEDGIAETRRAAAGVSGTLRIAVTPYAFVMPEIPRALARLRAHWTDVRIESVELLTDEQVAGLRSGDFDVAIGLYGAEDPDAIVATPVVVDAVNCAIIAEDHPLAGSESLSIEQLRHDRLLYYDRGVSRVIPAVVESIDRLGLEVAEEHRSMGALHWHVAARRGWTLGMSSQRDHAPIGTVAIPLRDFRAEAVIVARARAGDTSMLITRVIAALRGAETTEMPDAPPLHLGIENVELRQLRGIALAARERSLSRAAERIGLTQSGLSRQIASLEQALGVQLLNRVGTAAVPTIAGRAFAAHAERIIGAADELFASVQAGGDHLPGRCRLGVVATGPNQALLLMLLRLLAAEAPTLTVDVGEMLSPEIERRLIAREIDVGIASLYQPVTDPAVSSLVLEEDAIACALLPLNHALAGATSIRAPQLAGEPFVFLPRVQVPVLFDRVQTELELLGLRVDAGATASGPRAIRGMVAGGMGWTLGLRSQLADRHSDLAAVPIEGLSIRTATELLWRRADDRRETLTVIDACRGLARLGS
jgi:DNA-binding transcriptional LysR family regulator